MKIFKYVTVLLAVAAMSASFVSCDRDNDITGDPFADHNKGSKQNYWIEFTLSNAGSLTEKAQLRFVDLRDSIIYGEKGIKTIEHPMYCTEDYAKTNFNNVAALSDGINDIVQKIMIPTAQVDLPAIHKDFDVTMTLSKDSMRTTLATYVWHASTAVPDSVLNK